jgi:hypothetical protein
VAMSTCVVFAHGFGNRKSKARAAAFKFAKSRQPIIFQAFKEGKKRDDVLMWLASEWTRI